MTPTFLTFTGVDDFTDVARAQSLSARYPIEWGFLVGKQHGGRYPSEQCMQIWRAVPVRKSLHLCGPRSYEIFLRQGWDQDRFAAYERVQVNARSYNLTHMQRFAEHIARPVIVQCRAAFPEPLPGLHFLFDQSGGRGVEAPSWPSPSFTQEPSFYGYAGGLGPHNIRNALERVTIEKFWLDMESNIRTQDRLDLDLVEAVCQMVYGPRHLTI